MTRSPKIVSAIALFLAFTGPGFAKVSGQTQTQSTTADRQYRDAWDAPPQGLPEAQLMGFRDGVAGARKDFDKHRELNVNDRKEYLNPHLPADQKDAYCDGFRLGYERAASHFISGPEQPVAVLETKMPEPARSGRGTMQRQIRQAKSNSVDFRTALLARGQIWRTIAGRT